MPPIEGSDSMPVTPIDIPQVEFGHSGQKIPLIAFGLGQFPLLPDVEVKAAVLRGIEAGYRHFDTAQWYQSEQALGEAVQEALSLGLIQSRDELFITTKLWWGNCYPDLVVPALRESLRILKMECIDLFLIHWPLSYRGEQYDPPARKPDTEPEIEPMDFEGVWKAMEECQKLGLTKSIGVCNFSCKKLNDIMAIATIKPAVNQVEVNPFWQQKKLIEFCKEKGILVTAYCPLGRLGSVYGSNKILENEVLQEIAKSKGKSIPQVCLRWAYEQGIAVAVKSYNEVRMKDNLKIFDWELSEEDHEKIRGIPQSRGSTGSRFLSKKGPFRTVEEIWDGEG